MLVNIVIIADNISTMHVCRRAQNSNNIANSLCSHSHIKIDPIIYKSSAVAEMGDRARVKLAENWGLLCPFPCGELGFHLIKYGLGRGLPLYQVASWSIQLFGRNTPTLQTDRTGQRSDSIRCTVLQMVAQKWQLNHSIWRRDPAPMVYYG